MTPTEGNRVLSTTGPGPSCERLTATFAVLGEDFLLGAAAFSRGKDPKQTFAWHPAEVLKSRPLPGQNHGEITGVF